MIRTGIDRGPPAAEHGRGAGTGDAGSHNNVSSRLTPGARSGSISHSPSADPLLMDADLTKRSGSGSCTAEERALLARFRAGESTAFHALVRPHLPPLLALARRLTGDHQWAEDLTQETLVRAYRALEGFRAEASLRTWLFRIQIRLAGEPARWRRTERASSLADLDVPDQLGAAPEQPALQRELQDRLAEAMERLSTRQRTALHLRAVEGLDYAAIAGVMECTAGAARMLVLAARKRVLDRMGRYLAP